MTNQKLAAALAIFALTFGQAATVRAEGPYFTIPKTVVVVEMQVDRTVQSPGTFCEFADLFFPGLEMAVPCNGNVLPPLARPAGQQQASDVTDLDPKLPKTEPAARRAELEQRWKARKDAEQAEKKRKEELAALDPKPEEAAKLEQPLQQIRADEDELKKEEAFLKKMKDDKEAAKAEAKKQVPPMDRNQFYSFLEQGVAQRKASIDAQKRAFPLPCSGAIQNCDWNARVKAAEEKIKDYREPWINSCRGVALEACRAERTERVKEATAVTALETAEALKPDNRPSRPFAATRVKNISVTTRGTPDPDRVQDLGFASGFFKDTEQTFQMDEGATVQGINSSTTDRTAEFVLSLVKAAAGIAGRVITGSGVPSAFVEPKPEDLKLCEGPTIPKEKQAFCDENNFIKWLKQGVNSPAVDILLDNYAFLKDGRKKQYYVGYKDSKARVALSLAKRSWLSVGQLEKDYGSLLTPAGAGGLSALPVLEANRRAFDQRITADWIGSSKTNSWNPVYEFTPGKDSSTPEPAAALFRIAACGVDTAGGRLPVRNPRPGNLKCAPLENEDEGPEFTPVTLAMEPMKVKTTAAAAAAKFGNGPTAGLPFIVPGDAIVKTTGTGISLTDPQVLLAQWGFLAFLPESWFKKSGAVNVTYYQATGAIKSITHKKAAATSGSTVEGLGTAITGVLDAKYKATAAAEAEAKAAAESAAGEELKKWKRLQDTLTARKTAEGLCRELNINPCEP